VSARTRAAGLAGAPPVTPAVGATLAVLAAGAAARTVVSIGSGGGVAGLWLLEGMRPDGVLTVLDSDAESLRATRRAFADAGHPPGRTRMIFGTTGEVLPRLSPGAYDMVVCAGRPPSTPRTWARWSSWSGSAGRWCATASWTATGSPTPAHGTTRRRPGGTSPAPSASTTT
jgi:predicted O-methyltransferase YrrM